jgi:hypothetical protein
MKTWLFSVDSTGAHVFLIRESGSTMDFCYDMPLPRVDLVVTEIELRCSEGTSLVVAAELEVLEELLGKLEGTGVLERLIGVIPTNLARFSEEDLLNCAKGFRMRAAERNTRKRRGFPWVPDRRVERRAG